MNTCADATTHTPTELADHYPASRSLVRVPVAHTVVSLTMNDGAVLRLRRHGQRDAPVRLLISHGNGFAVDAYFPFWSHFLERYDVIVYDQRNHGWNSRTAAANHDVGNFIDDLDRILDALPNLFGERPIAGVFHSISAITALAHALEHKWRWHALAVFDPPLIPTPGDTLYELAHDFELGLAEWALERPVRFASPAELAERFTRSRSRRRWVAGAHELMARSILRADPGRGDWELACPPDYESRVYTTNAGLDLCPHLSSITGPLRFICCDADDADAWPPAQVNRAMRSRHRHPFTAIPDTDHMLQIERPQTCAMEVVSFIESQPN